MSRWLSFAESKVLTKTRVVLSPMVPSYIHFYFKLICTMRSNNNSSARAQSKKFEEIEATFACETLVDVSIEVKKAHNIDASEALVVCQRQDPRGSQRPAGASATDADSGTRLRLVRGPVFHLTIFAAVVSVSAPST